MDFSLTPEQLPFQELAKTFAVNHLAPYTVGCRKLLRGG
jgi:hypothetical protein